MQSKRPLLFETWPLQLSVSISWSESKWRIRLQLPSSDNLPSQPPPVKAPTSNHNNNICKQKIKKAACDELFENVNLHCQTSNCRIIILRAASSTSDLHSLCVLSPSCFHSDCLSTVCLHQRLKLVRLWTTVVLADRRLRRREVPHFIKHLNCKSICAATCLIAKPQRR